MSEGWNIARPGDDPPRFDDASRGPRLHKILAEAGLGSRRACEELIESGAVHINGHPVTRLPAWADPIHDKITVNGTRVRTRQHHVYVMLFKPRGVECSNDPRPGRRSAVSLVNHRSGARLYPVGRLDVDSSGLLILTNDGELANRLTHPRYGVHKKYEVTIEGSLDADAVRKLESGVFLSTAHSRRGPKYGRRTQGSRLKLLRRGRDRTRVLMELREGRNRQIRRMFLYVGHKVRKLRRVQMGPLQLRGLSTGQWRDLTPEEVEALKRIAYRKEMKGVDRSGGKSGKRS